MSTVRHNLLTQEHYSPYCGGATCVRMPRTTFDGEQFKCSCCGWRSQFDAEFIEQYKETWSIN